MFNWLFSKSRLRVFEDSFARTRPSMLRGLCSAIDQRLSVGRKVLVLTHFPDAFEELQDELAAQQIDYELLDRKIFPVQLQQLLEGAGNVYLGLAEFLNESEQIVTSGSNSILSVIVAERHPSARFDNQIESFFRASNCNVELGYLLSFEDSTLQIIVNESALKIFDMFGMGENELVTSNMISRRIQVIQNRLARQIETNYAADSAAQWLRLNQPAAND